MRKLAFKVTGVVFMAVVITLGPSMFFSIAKTRGIIKNQAINYLESEVKRKIGDFERVFTKVETITLALEGITKHGLTDEILGDDALFDSYREDAISRYRALASVLAPLDLYTWFDPDVLPRSRTISISDTEGQGFYTVEQEYDYTWDDIIAEGYEFFSVPKEKGVNWTDPYFWEAFNVDLFSYTKALMFNGRFIGVVGVDTSFEDMKKLVSESVILDSGYYFLLNGKADVLIHPTVETGKNMGEFIPEVVEEIVADSDGQGTIFYNFNDQQKVMTYITLRNGWILAGAPPVKEVMASINQLNRILVIMLPVVTLLALIIAFFIGRGMAAPVVALNKKLLNISQGEGDLTERLAIISRDETGQLAVHFNEFMEKLQVMILEMKDENENSQVIQQHLDEAAGSTNNTIVEMNEQTQSGLQEMENLNQQISESSSAALEISGNLDSFTRLIENQSSAVTQSTAAVEEMIASLENVARITENKEQSSQQLMDTTRQGGEMVEETTRQITEITGELSTIMEMTQLINNIASQTNLLSMNAAIEAAHAGDAGKGFSVVAEEIRKLAQDAAESANQISGVLGNMSSKIEKTNEVSNKTSSFFASIQNEVEDVTRAFTEISGSTQEISSGGQEILKAMSELNSISAEVTTGSAEMKEGTQSVALALDKINEISHEVLGQVEKTSVSTRDIRSNAETVASESANLSQVIQKLTESLGKFKV